MDIEGGIDSVNSMELVAKMEYSHDGYYTDETVCENSTGCNFNQYDVMSDNEKSQELLRMIIRSVEKKERRNSAKKLKRKRSNMRRIEVNGSEADNEMPAYSRCSITYLSKVLDKVRATPQYSALVKWMGFGHILHLHDCCVPRQFVQWIADNVYIDEEVIKIGSKSIKLSPQSVSDTFGTPSGELPVDSDEELGKAAFLAIFGLIDVPSIRFFGQKILSEEVLPDGYFCRSFMAVCLGTLLCPNSNTKVSTKYMGALVVVDKIKDRNWSKYIHQWTMNYIRKYLNEPANARRISRTLGGCIYHLAVRCLDFVDFSPIQIPPTLPRITVWKGNLIKVFSDMFMGTNGKYGGYPIRDIADTCYSNHVNISRNDIPYDEFLKQSILSTIGDLVDNKLKETISAAFISLMQDEEECFCMKAQDLVLQVVQAFVSNSSCSQDTLKLTSEEGSCKHGYQSASTEKMPGTEDVTEIVEDSVQTKRRRTGLVYSSDHTGHGNTRETAIQSDVKDSSCTENVLSNATQSVSLAYMLPVSAKSQNPNCSNDALSKVGVEVNEANTSSIDLNRACIENCNEGFTGFNGANTGQEESQFGSFIQNNEEIGACFEQNNCLGEHYDKSQVSSTPSGDRGDYLEKARHNYFFNDTGEPSFRLLEDEDDNGKRIEEPELHRPIGMDDYSYNKQIELAILTCKKSTSKITVNIHHDSPATAKKDCTLPSTINDNVGSVPSIQCAQREPSVTGLSNSPRWTCRQVDEFVDLVSPEVPDTSQQQTNLAYSSEKNTPDNSRAKIMGRRLFIGDDDDDDSHSESTKKIQNRGMSSNRAATDLLNMSGNQSSQEVEILGVKCMKDTFNLMNQQAEELYNTSLSLGTSSNGKENLLPQRIPQRSKYVCSPFDVNPSQSVAVEPIQQKVWEAVTTLCDIEPHNSAWAINIDNIRVSMQQLGSSMKKNGWLEAWLMNAFCRKLFRDNHPRKSNKHFFFNTTSDYFLEKWKNEEARLLWKHKAIESFVLSNKARSLHLSDGLYFPTVFNDHWFVFMVDIKYRNFIFLDSWYTEGSSYHKKVSKLMIKNFQNTWEEAGLKKMNFQTFGTAYPNVPKQKNGNDCGIFSMKYLELFCARNPAQCCFSHLDIPAFRIKYAHDIIMSDYNFEEDSKFLVTGFNA